MFGEFLARLNGSTTQFFDVAPCVASNASGVSGGFAGHCDWRLPTIVELEDLVDLSAPGCGSGSACLDGIFGGVSPGAYLTSTTHALNLSTVWYVEFVTPTVSGDSKFDQNYAIAVRGGWQRGSPCRSVSSHPNSSLRRSAATSALPPEASSSRDWRRCPGHAKYALALTCPRSSGG